MKNCKGCEYNIECKNRLAIGDKVRIMPTKAHEDYWMPVVKVLYNLIWTIKKIEEPRLTPFTCAGCSVFGIYNPETQESWNICECNIQKIRGEE